MKSIRAQSENFIYGLFEKFSTMVYENGEQTEFYGIKVLEEKENFVRGTLINATTNLYIRYVKENDEREKRTLNYLNNFIDTATSLPCKTWGKLSILRALVTLKRANLLQNIDNRLLEKCKASTDYSDFFDKEELKVIDLPSNYLQVALACALFREKLGFENDGYSKKIINVLISLMEESLDGWMDEAPPYKRFDRYSFLVSSELSDTFMLADADFPKIFEDNLRLAASHCLFMANAEGDGWNYGRSLSCHGDGAISEILSSAMSRNLLNTDEKALALAYISKITEKVTTFWFDKERDSFNIWWDGRSTNSYRQVHRVMQVGLDMALHLLSTLKNLEMANMSDVEPDVSLIPCPNVWKYDELVFSKDENQIAEAVILRKDNLLVMLPLIGLGHHIANSAYMPYPAICRKIESAPEGPMPFLIPEYISNGVKYRPCQYFSNVAVSNNSDTLTVKADGRLVEMGEKMPKDSKIPFSVIYTFNGNTINIEFLTDAKFDEARAVTGIHDYDTEISAFGFESQNIIFKNPNPNDYRSFNINTIPKSERNSYKYMTPHGFIIEAIEYQTTKTNRLSFLIKL